MITPQKLAVLISAFLLSFLTIHQGALHAATVLPGQSGYSVIAEWGGTSSFWAGAAPQTTPVTGLSTTGDFALSSSVSVANRLPGALNRAGAGASYTITATNATGGVPDKFSLQLASFYSPTAITFTIGGVTYNQGQASVTSLSNFHTSGYNDARYTETGWVEFAQPTLWTYTWDLDALGFTGTDFSSYSLNLNMPGNMHLYDVQLSQLSAVVVPEPSIAWLAQLGMAALLLRRKRQTAWKPSSPC